MRVHHMQGGRGSPVVFIHGLGSSGYMEWRHTLEPAAGRHRVFAPDLAGYGRTEKPRARYTIPYFARFVERYLEDRGLRSAVIVGASLGGRIALEVALEQPRLARKLVLVNSLGLGRPQARMAQMAYGLVTIPRVGEAVMRFTRRALGWASPRTIGRVAGARRNRRGRPPPPARRAGGFHPRPPRLPRRLPPPRQSSTPVRNTERSSPPRSIRSPPPPRVTRLASTG